MNASIDFSIDDVMSLFGESYSSDTVDTIPAYVPPVTPVALAHADVAAGDRVWHLWHGEGTVVGFPQVETFERWGGHRLVSDGTVVVRFDGWKRDETVAFHDVQVQRERRTTLPEWFPKLSIPAGTCHLDALFIVKPIIVGSVGVQGWDAFKQNENLAGWYSTDADDLLSYVAEWIEAYQTA